MDTLKIALMADAQLEAGWFFSFNFKA